MIGEGVCSAISPRLELLHTRSLSSGDGECIHFFKYRETPSLGHGDYGELIATMLSARCSEQQLLEYGLQYSSELWVLTVRAFIDAIGAEGAIGRLRPMMIGMGASRGLQFLEGTPAELTKEERMAMVMKPFARAMDWRIDTTSRNGCIGLAVSQCPFDNLSPEVCMLLDSFIEGLAMSVDPRVHVKVDKIGCETGSLCNFHIKMPKK
jgi:hypothetical protein